MVRRPALGVGRYVGTKWQKMAIGIGLLNKVIIAYERPCRGPVEALECVLRRFFGTSDGVLFANTKNGA